jgi:hypothetical protein
MEKLTLVLKLVPFVAFLSAGVSSILEVFFPSPRNADYPKPEDADRPIVCMKGFTVPK